MRVLLCTNQTLSMPGGGMRTQVLKTEQYLTRLGIQTERFSAWKHYQWDTIDIVHVFVSDMTNYFLLSSLPKESCIVISPIIDKTYNWPKIRILEELSGILPKQVLTSYRSHQLAFRKARAVISRSSDEYTKLQKGFKVNVNKIFTVPCGVDSEYIEAKPDLFIDRYSSKDFVLYVGQIGNPRKNLTRLLRVARQLKEVEFVLIGPILATREGHMILNLSQMLPNVRVLGPLPAEFVKSAFAAAHTLVLPSVIEGVGLVTLEAGLAGAQIVVTPHGGPRDYLGDHVIYVNPQSEESIRKGLVTSLNRPKDNLLREYIFHNYLWENVTRKLVDVYETALVNKVLDGKD